MRHRHDTNKWIFWAVVGILALACIFICSDFVRAENLKYDIITYADPIELGRKVCGVIGYVDTVYEYESNLKWSTLSPENIEKYGWNCDSIIYVRTYIPTKEDSLRQDPPPLISYAYYLWYTIPVISHRQWVNTIEVYKPKVLTFKNYPDTIKGEATVWWREVTK